MGATYPESEWIWHNGAAVPWREAQIHMLASAVQFGLSVFEGIRCYETEYGPAVFRLPEHIRRLRRSALIYDIPLAYTDAELIEACLDVVRRNQLGHCYIRPTVLLGYGSPGLEARDSPVETYIPAWDWGAYFSDSAASEGIAVGVSSWHRPAPNTLPVMAKAGGHYASSYLIKREARRNGFDEAIALAPDGTVSEGSGQNLFLVRDGRLLTPAIAGSNLEGITRDTVITLARDLGLEVETASVPRDMLYCADELFFTGTASELVPIRSVDHKQVGDGSAGLVTALLRTAFADATDGRDAQHADWLTPVDPAKPSSSPAKCR